MRRDSFVAVLARARNPAPLAATGLAPRLALDATGSRPGLAFHGAAAGPVLILPHGLGIVWGRLFDCSGAMLRQVPEPTARAWVTSGGALLVDRFWGSYVALLAAEDRVIALRDPSGALPCYIATAEQGVVLASDARRAQDAGATGLAIDWTEVLSELQFVGRRTARTALAGITELLPGTALSVTQEHLQVDTLWSPYRFAAGWRDPPAFEEARRRVREAIALSVRGLTTDHHRPLSELSGGVDSSVVTAALHLARRDARCVTVRGGDADLDETGYARKVAQHFGFPWRSVTLDRQAVDLRRSDAAALPRPSARAFAQAVDRASLAAAAEMGCDAFVSGGGGDNVLWYFQTVAPALDRLQCEGVGGFLATLNELAWMTGASRADALRHVVRRWLRRRPRPWPHDVSLLAPDVRTLEPMPAHPWLPAPPGTLPGVQAYARLLVLMQGHFEWVARAETAPVLAPLLAQPVVETCLAVPSWLWCRDGQNRAVARAAFRDLLPAAILARGTKGGFDGFSHGLFVHNRDLVRDLLLGGCLAEQRLLDLPAIEALLGNEARISNLLANRLLRLVSVEAWLRSWSGRLG
ncbi:asparagine synthase-related protein [Sphingomonas sp. UNC305MFCol5.2]|uniref:asparagine synthase-related protein n=1 Tax=Sphingomonas sp. UNC305MFCol5.2 TaxID=1449076 RepID=UPI00056327B5|nr:asparagine synthetase B family protein [Sphingomonas sp. UNC305MFCol5.2]